MLDGAGHRRNCEISDSGNVSSFAPAAKRWRTAASVGGGALRDAVIQGSGEDGIDRPTAASRSEGTWLANGDDRGTRRRVHGHARRHRMRAVTAAALPYLPITLVSPATFLPNAASPPLARKLCEALSQCSAVVVPCPF